MEFVEIVLSACAVLWAKGCLCRCLIISVEVLENFNISSRNWPLSIPGQYFLVPFSYDEILIINYLYFDFDFFWLSGQLLGVIVSGGTTKCHHSNVQL